MTESFTPIIVSVPARPDVLHVLRAVIASVAARANMPVDTIDELRIAVDEAVTLLLASATASVVRVEIEENGSSLGVVASTDALVDPWPLPGTDSSWAWRVLSGLSDESSFVRTALGPGVRFAKHRAARVGA